MDQPRSSDLRGLKALVGILSALIVLGTALVIGVVIQRLYAKPETASMTEPGPAAPVHGPLALPAGLRIAGIASAGGEVAVWVSGPGVDQIWLVDPLTGAHFVAMTAPK
jgi:hypothetical protein